MNKNGNYHLCSSGFFTLLWFSSVKLWENKSDKKSFPRTVRECEFWNCGRRLIACSLPSFLFSGFGLSRNERDWDFLFGRGPRGLMREETGIRRGGNNPLRTRFGRARSPEDQGILDRYWWNFGNLVVRELPYRLKYRSFGSFMPVCNVWII